MSRSKWTDKRTSADNLMGDEFTDISTAARHRDWNSCDQLMFRQLYQLSFQQQKFVTLSIIALYMPIWSNKQNHLVDNWATGLTHFRNDPSGNDESAEVDAADAEFEHALVEFQDALLAVEHSLQTTHFATSVRSTVIARQIAEWIKIYPEKYSLWRQGQYFSGPTFFEDEGVLKVAEQTWRQVDGEFRQVSGRKPQGSVGRVDYSAPLEQAYEQWVRSLR